MAANTRFTVACIQNTAGTEPEASLPVVADLVRQARQAGADFITTPEMALMIDPNAKAALAKAVPEANHPGVAAFRELAKETGAWLLGGSFAVHCDGERMWNRSILFSPAGDIVARYSKIFMFDVDLPGGQSFRESRRYRPGEEAVLASLPWGTLGMTVCYDLRFPQLYRHLAQAGADFLTVPSAFMKLTGEAHWHVLLRARAIETGCFVIAAAQTGTHANNRQSYGHSLIVAPWGEVLADGGTEVGFVTAEIDTARIAEARRQVPSLQHDRPYAPATPIARAAE